MPEEKAPSDRSPKKAVASKIHTFDTLPRNFSFSTYKKSALSNTPNGNNDNNNTDGGAENAHAAAAHAHAAAASSDGINGINGIAHAPSSPLNSESQPSPRSDRYFVPIGPPTAASSSLTTPESKRSRVSFTAKRNGVGGGGVSPTILSTAHDDYCPPDIPEPRTPPHLSFVVSH